MKVLMMANATLLVNCAVAVVFLLSMEYFKSEFHSLEMFFHFLEASSCSPGIFTRFTPFERFLTLAFRSTLSAAS